MAVIRPTFPDDHYTRVPNAWLRDPHLDPAPKAYLAYLLSHAAGFRCSTSLAARDMGVNRSTVSAWNAKLVERGYFLTVEQSRASGKFGENDYTITPCTATAPPLPENPSLFPRETARSTDTEKPTRSNRARETQHIEEQGEKNTPAPTEQGASVDRHLRPVDGMTVNQRAKHLTDEHYEACGGLENWNAVAALVRKALTAGHDDDAVRRALTFLRDLPRNVTGANLRAALESPRTLAGNGYRAGPNRTYGPLMDIPTDPDAHRGAF